MKLKAGASHSSYNPAAFLPPPTQQRAWSIVRATTEVIPYTLKRPKTVDCCFTHNIFLYEFNEEPVVV